LVIANFNLKPQTLPIGELRPHGFFQHEGMKDLCSGTLVPAEHDVIVIPPLTSYWLADWRERKAR
jgi:hypothetical protein